MVNDMTLDELKDVLERANDDVDRVSPHEYREALNASYKLLTGLVEAVKDTDIGYDCGEYCKSMQPYRGCRCGGKDLRTFIESMNNA